MSNTSARRARARARKRQEAAAAALAAAPPPNVKCALRVLALDVEVRHALAVDEQRTRCGQGIIGAYLERGAPDCPDCLGELARELLGNGANS